MNYEPTAMLLNHIAASPAAVRWRKNNFVSVSVLANKTAVRVCSHPGCNVKLTWDDFTIDHIHPTAKAARASLPTPPSCAANTTPKKATAAVSP